MQSSGVDELPPGALPPMELARENALIKAQDIFSCHPNDCVLGADTVVVIEGQTLGKPRDLAEGARMLRLLSGRWHEVVTGVALLAPEREEVFAVETRVRFRDLKESDIADYHAKVHVLDKAGGYAIQDGGERIIAEVDGCRDNVMGLPIGQVLSALENFSL